MYYPQKLTSLQQSLQAMAEQVADQEQQPAQEMQAVDILPKHTIYINNLNDKVKMNTMKQSLHAAFSPYGPIIDIIMRKSYRLRGQAFIVFQDVESAAKAIRTMQAFPFYDKPLNIRYSKTESDQITRQKGTFVHRTTKPKLEIRKPKEKTSSTSSAAIDSQEQEPNRILFLTNLPPEANDAMLSILFNQFPGFKEVRLIPGRSDIAFVEFDNEHQSKAAKDNLNGFNLSPVQKLQINFAKK